MPVHFAYVFLLTGTLISILGWPSDVLAHSGYQLTVQPTELRPTQACVGYSWIDRKLSKFLKLSAKDVEKRLREESPGAVIGPGGNIYVLDNHHEFYTLIELKVKTAYVTILADYSHLGMKEFERRMIEKKWVYFGDENGRLSHSMATLPESIASLRDDPYRSLASFLRHAGGFKKTDEYFMEFKWANALRRVIPLKLIQADPTAAVERALEFAKGLEARELPGYIGKTSENSCEKNLD